MILRTFECFSEFYLGFISNYPIPGESISSIQCIPVKLLVSISVNNESMTFHFDEKNSSIPLGAKTLYWGVDEVHSSDLNLIRQWLQITEGDSNVAI